MGAPDDQQVFLQFNLTHCLVAPQSAEEMG